MVLFVVPEALRQLLSETVSFKRTQRVQIVTGKEEAVYVV